MVTKQISSNQLIIILLLKVNKMDDWEDDKVSANEQFFWQSIFLFVVFVIAIVFAVYAFVAKAETHDHGINVPDWYDNDCCNNNDCRPVENNEVDFFSDKFAQPIAIYTHGDIIRVYDKSRWRKSKDERYHACFRGEIVYCIYIPIGA